MTLLEAVIYNYVMCRMHAHERFVAVSHINEVGPWVHLSSKQSGYCTALLINVPYDKQTAGLPQYGK